MHGRERAKYLAYRTPVVRRLMTPRYPYKVNPSQLAMMVELIEATTGSGAAIGEVGVAQGDTSVFLLEHLRDVSDERTLHLFDTFSGFTPTSIEVEVSKRGKERQEYDKFRYGDAARFERNLRSRGYDAFRIVPGDASAFDWSSLTSVGALLLDVDLYEPTIKVLEAVYPMLAPGGGIVLDDCLPDTPWDGSLQAYQEFIGAHGLPFIRVGHKGALVRGPEKP